MKTWMSCTKLETQNDYLRMGSLCPNKSYNSMSLQWLDNRFNMESKSCTCSWQPFQNTMHKCYSINPFYIYLETETGCSHLHKAKPRRNSARIWVPRGERLLSLLAPHALEGKHPIPPLSPPPPPPPFITHFLPLLPSFLPFFNLPFHLFLPFPQPHPFLTILSLFDPSLSPSFSLSSFVSFPSFSLLCSLVLCESWTVNTKPFDRRDGTSNHKNKTATRIIKGDMSQEFWLNH